MNFTEDLYKNIVYKMLNAYALHRIILDNDGKPCNYQYIDVNSAFEELIGINKENLLGKNVLDVIPDINEDEENWIEKYGKVALTGEQMLFNSYSNALKKWFVINAYSPKQGYFITIFNEITEMKTKDEILSNLAYYDQLTGLENRVCLLMNFDKVIKKRSKSNYKIAMLILDLDNFKIVNDTMGHRCGDEVIIEIARRIRNQCPTEYHVARIGGDEFAIIQPIITTEQDVSIFSENIRKEIDRPIIVEESLFNITSSIGISIYPQDGDNVKELLMNADTAMYKAKQKGKNSICFYTPQMKLEVLRRTNMENLLRQAVSQQQFKLYFQPQYYMGTGKIRGLEALIRWNNPQNGLISPMYFIPLAEETGLIVHIGDWVIKETCRLGRLWREQFGFKGILSINISPIELRNIHFFNNIKEILQLYDMTNYVEFEITENIFIEKLQTAINTLNQIKQLGVKISLDDFGTGYSSLNYLKNLPLDTLKIDKSFIANIVNNSAESHITECIISMAHKLGLETIAEGVEQPDQFLFLKGIGCNIVQGYLTGKPVSSEEVTSIFGKSAIHVKEG